MIVEPGGGYRPDGPFDVCVVGAGPAGITVALSLARAGLRVFLAEAGGREVTAQSQSFYEGAVVGDPYYDLSLARLRCLGGTSNHWGGWCRGFDAHDFEAKRAAPQTRWPIRREALAPYDAGARRILELAPQAPDRPLPGTTDLLRIGFTESRPPVRFGTRFAEEMARLDTLTLCLNANLTGLDVEEGVVTAVRLRDYGDTAVRVEARHVVLACGGIENARHLLIANRRYGDRLGNQGGCVGRYWMEHPTFRLGDFLLFVPWFGDDVLDPAELNVESLVHCRWFMAPTRRFLNDHGILNCAIRLEPVHTLGVKRYVADLLCKAPPLSVPLMQRLGRNLRCAGTVSAAWEQEPLAANRVALGEEPDAFGLPRVVLHWRKSALDRRTLSVTALAVARWLAEQDVGRARFEPWVLDPALDYPDEGELAGYHHMGGTRMGTTPRDGVVDADGRVFGTRNLFVAGSSVFPSGGHANPTQTIVQLALRLADHLQREATRKPLVEPARVAE